MDCESTNNPATARRWSVELFGEGNPAQFFLSPVRFESAQRTTDSFAMTLSGEQRFGLGLGPNPPRRDDWTRCVLTSIPDALYVGELRASDFWDFYSIDTAHASSDGDVEVLENDALVTEILQVHANDSSVWPGSREIVDWFALRDPDDELVALGALVQWESGLHVVSSVTTLREYRGRGFAQELVQGIVARARERGIRWLGLGVGHSNVAAQRVYQKVGFQLRENFTTYSTANPIELGNS